MSTKKIAQKEQPLYSYDAFLRTFYPEAASEQPPKTEDPDELGTNMAAEALKKVKSILQQQQG